MKLKSLQKFLWMLTGISTILFVCLLFWTNYRGNDTQSNQSEEYRAEFELTDHQGSVRTEQDFTGQWLLVFFGFANCPDVCPTTLAEVAAVVEGLGNDASDVQPLFISIDPARDTPAALAEFVPLFNAGIIGLTGSPQQIARTAETFHIYYEMIEDASAPNDYTMGHSSQLFLFDPTGDYVTSWQYGTLAEEILSDLKENLRK